ncbi:MAG: SAVED domain-containing protein [Thermofilaceae archaeon]
MARIVVLEIGRPIKDDVVAQLGQEPFRVISYPRPVTEAEYPQILREAYRAIREASRGGEEVALVLSGPLALSFQLGQLVGLSHFKVKLYQFSGGRYVEVPPVTREVMF